MLVLQSCTDSLQLLPVLCSETFPTSYDDACLVGNIKVEVEIYIQEEEYVNVKIEKGVGSEEEECMDIKEEQGMYSEEEEEEDLDMKEEEDVDVKEEVSCEDKL